VRPHLGIGIKLRILESIWAPQSALMEPLTQPSQSVNLTRIVADVMGPQYADPVPRFSPEQGVRNEEQEKEQKQGVAPSHSC
jgi:hypothetical protein